MSILFPKATLGSGSAISPPANAGGLLTFQTQVSLIGPLWVPSPFKSVVEDARKTTGRFGKQLIASRTPVKTGLLKSRWNFRGYRIMNTVYYGMFVEYGTIFMDGYFMATDSVEEISDKFNSEIMKNLRKKFAGSIGIA